jgi:hypothetical protein
MNKSSTNITNKSLNYTRADILTSSNQASMNTTVSEVTGRTVITTKTTGTVALRYAPKYPKENNLSTSNSFE